ncbi:ATP-binding SpoIIE family protein phosphatase, partial [Streptomyces sp. NPDC004290]
AVYVPVAGRCSLACAGHPAPVIVSPDGSAGFLELPAGPPLGVGGVPFETTELEVPEGSLLAFYTDGLVESRQRDLESGLEELRQALTEPCDSLETLCDHVLKRLLSEPPADDAALLLVRLHGLNQTRVATWDVAAEPAAVARIRAGAARRLEEWGLEEIGFVTELVVSELVTNAIRYGQPPVQLRLIHDRDLICEVSDAGSSSPHLRRARGAALGRPARQQRRQRRAAGSVGVGVQGDVRARRERLVEQGQQFAGAALVHPEVQGGVRQMQRAAGRAGQLHHLAVRLQGARPVGAVVRAVVAAVGGHHLAQLAELGVPGVHAGRIGEPRGHADRALLH